jgi:hypothetical protein
MSRRCECQDSSGAECNKTMTDAEFKQDGMCDVCASNVWAEFKEGADYEWFHEKESV